jgi:spore germination protein YaaH
LGWHPYWVSSTAHQLYDYEALTHIAYFSYEVDTVTGGYTTIHDWNTTPIISYAHQRGTKVLLTVTNFGTTANTKILSDTVKQVTMLNNLVNLLKVRNGDGVNFDFELVPATQKTNMVNFVKRAVRIIKKELPGAEISLATPAVDWSSAWDFASLSALCDYLIVMGYDYYYKGSSTAGPVAPLEGENYNISRTIDTYLNAGVSPEKLLLGVPWYGYDWPVVSNIRKAAVTGTGTARVFTAAEALADTHGKTFDQITKVPWVAYTSSSLWRQLWYDDIQSLSLKYDYVNSKNIGGIGIWALSYNGGEQEVWDAIKASFNTEVPETDQLMKIFPVPTSGQVTIEFFITLPSQITIEVFNTQGRRVLFSERGEFPQGINTLDFDIARFGSGVYICILRTGSSAFTRKILLITE